MRPRLGARACKDPGLITALLVVLLVALLVRPSAGADSTTAREPTTVHRPGLVDTTRAESARFDTMWVDPLQSLLEGGGAVAQLGTSVLTGSEDITAERFWRREPLGFNRHTPGKAWRLLTGLPDRAGEIAIFVRKHASTLGLFLGLTAAALVLAALIRRFVAVRLARELGQWLQPWRSRMPDLLSRATRSVVRLISAVLAPILVLGIYHLVQRLTGFSDPWFQALGDLLRGWTMLAVGLALLRELLLVGMLHIERESGRQLYRDLRRAALIGFLGLVLIAVARRGKADPDILAFATFGVELAFLVAATLALRRRQAVLCLFPSFDNRIYQGFLRWFRRFYGPAFVFTVAVLLAGLIGYRRLATFLLVRSWLLVAIFVATVGLHAGITRLLRRWITPEPEPTPEAKELYRSTLLLLTYVTVIATGTLFLHILGVLQPITRVLGFEFMTIGDQQVSALLIIKAIAIILAFVFFGRLISNYLESQIYPALRIDPGVGTAINTMIMGLLVGIGTVIGLTTVGLNLQVLTFFAGALGLGLGFGLQSFAGNLVSGLTIIFGRQLRRGDYISVGDHEGIVQNVGIRATRIRSRDAIEYTIPNSTFLSNEIINWSYTSPMVRVHVPIGVSYSSDPEAVRGVFLEVAKVSPLIEPRPEPAVWFVGFGDSSIDFELLVWVDVRRFAVGEVKSQLYFAAFKALREQGIEIPFPQRDIHVRSGLHPLPGEPRGAP